MSRTFRTIVYGCCVCNFECLLLSKCQPFERVENYFRDGKSIRSIFKLAWTKYIFARCLPIFVLARGCFHNKYDHVFFWWQDLKRHCLHEATTEALPKSNRLDCHTTEIAWILKFASQKTSWPHWCGFRTQKIYIKQSQDTQHYFLFAKDKSDTHRRMCLCIWMPAFRTMQWHFDYYYSEHWDDCKHLTRTAHLKWPNVVHVANSISSWVLLKLAVFIENVDANFLVKSLSNGWDANPEQ